MRSLTLLFILSFAINISAQSKFQTVLSASSGDFSPYDILELQDGTYATLTVNIGTGSNDGPVISHLNADGTLDWSKQLIVGTNATMASGVQQMADGNLIITGDYHNTSGYGVFALKLDMVNYSIIWSKAIELSTISASSQQSILTSDNAVLFSGRYYNGSSDVTCLMKVSDAGVIQWTKQYTGTTLSVESVVDMVERTNIPNTYYVLFNTYNSSSGKYVDFVALVNSTGGFISSEFLNPIGGNDVTGSGICNYSGGNGCLVTGSYYDGTRTNNLIYQFDAGLTLQKCNTYTCSSTSVDEFNLRKIANAPNGNYLAYGGTSAVTSVFGQDDAIFMELDANLNSVKGSVYGDALSNSIKNVRFTSDSGWVSLGDYMDPNAPPPSSKVYIVRADKDFSSGCSEMVVNFSSQAVTATTNIPAVTLGGLTYTNGTISPSLTSVTINENLFCTTPICKITLSGIVTDTYCAYGNGAINVTQTNGFLPVSYSWSNSATTEDLASLSPGTYSVTATDNNGCTASQTFTVNGSAPISVSTSNYVYPTCYDSYDGSVNLTINTGTAPYSASWNEISGYGSYSYTGVNPTGMPSGDYDLYITDNNGCTFDTTISVYGPYQVTANLNYSTNPNCNGSADGSITIYGDGGNYTYTYQWDAATGNQTGSSASGLSAGSYNVVVTDGNGCQGTGTFSITDPTPLQSSATSTDVLCNGQLNGSINVTTSGGTIPYSFSWSSGQTTEDISNVGAGSYNITVTDNNNCTLTSTYTVNQPNVLLSPITSIDALCNGDCNGQLTANPTGGTPPYQYTWNDPSGQTTQTAVGLCAGTYNLNVSDANNCQVTPSGTVNEPQVLTVSMNLTNSTCGDSSGIAEAIVSGGTSPYTYAWSVVGSSNPLTNLAPGSYGVTVADVNACSQQATFNINDTIYPINICVVTVDSTSTKNVVVWEKPVVGNINSYNIYRDIVGNYTLVGSVPYDSLSQFVDTTNGINPNVTSYRYKITAIDTCGNESVMSSLHETIHLTVNQGTNNESNLIWDAYQGINFVYYRIMRDTMLNGSWVAIDSVTSSNFTYTDWSVFQNGANYMIEIVLPYTCTSTKQQSHNTTRSNRAIVAGGNPGSGIEEELLAQAQVYPNPFNELLTVYVGTTNWSYSIVDVAGKLIKNERSNQTLQQLDLSELENGVYFIQIRVGNNTTTKKIIKN